MPLALTDEEIEAMTARLEASTLEEEGGRWRVRPEIVLEIAFDGVQPSTRHVRRRSGPDGALRSIGVGSCVHLPSPGSNPARSSAAKTSGSDDTVARQLPGEA